MPSAGQFVSSAPRLEDQATKDLSNEGLLDCPYSGLGGVIVKGEIVRNARLNLRGIRALRGATDVESQKLQQYVLALGLFALTCPVNGDLREGCNLVATKTAYSTFAEDGTRSDITLKHDDVLAFAKSAAKDFGVGDALEFIYDQNAANASASRTAGRRKGGKSEDKEEWQNEGRCNSRTCSSLGTLQSGFTHISAWVSIEERGSCMTLKRLSTFTRASARVSML